MPKYIVTPQVITDEMVIDFDSLPRKSFYSDVLIPINELEVSEQLLNFALQQTPYYPFKLRNPKTKVENIGYGSTSDLNNQFGILETQAYSDWIVNFKDQEREFKKFFTTNDQLTQNQYDALVSLYVFSGRWDSVGSEIVSFNIKPWIQDQDWNRVGTALILNGTQRKRTQSEAKIMLLGDYGRQIPRSVLKKKGVQLIKGFYNRTKDAVVKQQCEIIYYISTSRFLPGLTQPRKRQIVDYIEENKIELENILDEATPELIQIIELDPPIIPE